MIKWIVCLLVAVAFLSGPSVWAQDKGADKAFKKLDKDGNGSISLEEYKALAKGDDGKAEKLEKKFKKLDTDGNGSLSPEEFAKGMGKGGKKKKKDDNN